MRILFNFLVPGSLLIAGTVLFLNSPFLSKITPFQIDSGASILVLLTALLAWRFDRSRIIYLLQTLLYTDIVIRTLVGPIRATLLPIIIAILLISLSFLALLKERGIHSVRGIFVTASPLIQAALLFFWFKTTRNLSLPNIETAVLNLPPPLSELPELILLLIIVALLTQSIRFLRYPNPLEGGLLWVIIALTAALFYPAGVQTTLLISAAILTLLISFIEMSHTLAYKDELTGLPGRRALMERVSKLGSRYSIAMVDIDFFKKFNDTHGHDVGDQVLKMVAARLAKCNGGGRAYRYGGEEFCIVFPGKTADNCLEPLEEVRSRIADQPFSIRKLARPLKKPKKAAKKNAKSNSVHVTVSIGVAEKTPRYSQPDAVLKQSDLALYRAKSAGRNRVCSEKKG